MQASASRRHLPPRLLRFVGATAVLAVALVAVTAAVWAPTMGPTGLALAAFFALAEAHPLQLRHRGRAESIVLGELAVAIAALALPVAEVPWIAIGGAVLSAPVVRLVATHERLRIAPLERQVLNTAKNVVGLAPLVGLAAITRPLGTTVTWVAVVVGLLLHSVITHVLVRGAVDRARGSTGPSLSRLDVTEILEVPLVQGLVALPLGLLVLRDGPDAWPVVVLMAVGLVLVTRARMGRETIAYRLSVVTDAVDELAAATSVPDFDDRMRRVVARSLAAGDVRLLDSRPPRPPAHDQVVGRLGDTGPWVSVTDPRSSSPWTGLDRELLDTLLAAASPTRRRLEDLARAEEAERFASLLLTAAGHDVANQLHAARLATATLLSRGDGLPEETRALVLDRADAALRRGSRALSDMVALGAGGPESRCSGADVALFVRAISPHLRVVADNVVIGAPAAIVERIIENLVTNAARHHVDRSPVEVAVAKDGDDVRIAVRDRGPGLEAEDVELLFRPFAQLADGPRRRGSLGLGLFIARGLAESVGGTLGYADRVGGGAQFEVRLPSVREHVPEGPQERVVLGPRADGHPQAAVEPRLRREVPDQDALRQ